MRERRSRATQTQTSHRYRRVSSRVGASRPGACCSISARPAFALSAFAYMALTARDETNLDALTDELTSVVQATLQPEGVSVWLKTNPGE